MFEANNKDTQNGASSICQIVMKVTTKSRTIKPSISFRENFKSTACDSKIKNEFNQSFKCHSVIDTRNSDMEVNPP